MELIGFKQNTKTSLTELLNGKTYDENCTEKNNEKDGHTFLILNEIRKSKYLIKIKDISTIEDIFKVNIQVFEKTEKGNRRILNPGNFNLTERKDNSKKNSELFILKNLIITLTFK